MEVVVEESEMILAEKDKEVVKVVEEIKKVGFKVLRCCKHKPLELDK